MLSKGLMEELKHDGAKHGWHNLRRTSTLHSVVLRKPSESTPPLIPRICRARWWFHQSASLIGGCVSDFLHNPGRRRVGADPCPRKMDPTANTL
jgi:hypothetical protein